MYTIYSLLHVAYCIFNTTKHIHNDFVKLSNRYLLKMIYTVDYKEFNDPKPDVNIGINGCFAQLKSNLFKNKS